MGIKPMTEGEAIIRIKDHMGHHGIGIYPHIKLAEALNMAISALSSKSAGVLLVMKHLREMDDQRSVEEWLECCICCDTCIHNLLPGYEKPCSDCQESGELASWTAKHQYCPKCGRPLTNEAWTPDGEAVAGGTKMITREQLEESRRRGHNVYGYKKAFCELHSSCDVCDKKVRYTCKIICLLEDIQSKRILKICRYKKED